MQTPAEQVAVPLAAEHTLPHVPQLDGEVFRFASQPLDELPSQSPSPAAHEDTPQMPLTQLGVPPVAEHT